MPSVFRSKRRITALFAGLALIGTAGFVLLRHQQECKAETPSSAKDPVDKSVSVVTLDVKAERFSMSIPATGTLLPRETVTLVSELSRRLIKIDAEEGARVKKGAALFELDTTDLRAERRRLEVQLGLAKSNAARQQELFTARVGSMAEVEAAQSARQEIEASLGILDVTLAKAVIRAPFDGTLGLRKVSAGAWVTPATLLITIADTSELKIDFRVPERHADAVRPGATFSVHLDGQAQALPGQVLATESAIDVDSRSLLVRGVIKSEGAVVPGSFARVDLPLVLTDAILIPSIAVIPSVEGRGVFVARDGKAHLIPIEVGARTPERVQVTSGIKVGDQVITSNLLRLQNGTSIRLESEAK